MTNKIKKGMLEDSGLVKKQKAKEINYFEICGQIFYNQKVNSTLKQLVYIILYYLSK